MVIVISSDSNLDTPVKSLTLFFPCYNEKDAIGPLTKKTLNVAASICDDFEILLIDDGSSDGTSELADELANQYPQVRAVHHPRNSGYGAALQTGFRNASKEYVFYTDGDGQFDIAELPRLIPLAAHFDIVSCYRIKRQEGGLRRFNAFCWTALMRLLFNLKIKDIDCAFKLYKRDIFDHIEMHSTGALIDTEILARAQRQGYTITQMGVHHYPRLTGQSTGSNINVIFRAFRELFKLRREIRKTGKP